MLVGGAKWLILLCVAPIASYGNASHSKLWAKALFCMGIASEAMQVSEIQGNEQSQNYGVCNVLKCKGTAVAIL